MPRRGENIRKRKDGRWEARYIEKYTNDGKTYYKSVYGSTYTEVKSKLKLYKNCEKAEDIISCMSMEKLCDEWLENKKIRVKQSTFTRYNNMIQKHILPYFGNMKAKNLTTEAVNRFFKDKSNGGRLDNKTGGLSAKTIHDLSSLLVQIIKYAQAKKYISGFNYDVTLPKITVNELAILSPIEQSKLVSYVQLNFDIEKSGVLLSLYMGVRLGELCALKWNDVNFETETLRIDKTIQRIKDIGGDTKTKIIIDTPKSEKSVRDIPIPSFLLDLLRKYKSNPYYYILSGTAKYIEPRIYQAKFKSYLKSAGVQDINFHALRHTFATRAIEQGFDVKSLSEILGHSSVRFTLERYVHPSYELKRMNMEKLISCY